MASEIRSRGFDAILILPTSFSAAMLAFAAGIPNRIGWADEGRSFLLTHIVERPHPRQRHLVWEYLDLARKGLGRPLPSKHFQLLSPLSKESKKEAGNLLKGLASKGLIGVVPGGAFGPARRWPMPYWVELMTRLMKERKESFLILGGKEELSYLEPLIKMFPPEFQKRIHSLVGKTNVPALAGVLSQCRLLISNDTGPMHVGAAVGTPTVALYASTSPTWTHPFGSELIYPDIECSPCFQRTCPIGYKCLHAISVEQVWKAAQRQLKKPRRVHRETMPPAIWNESNIKTA
jgi:heptosyltransferase II